MEYMTVTSYIDYMTPKAYVDARSSGGAARTLLATRVQLRSWRRLRKCSSHPSGLVPRPAQYLPRQSPRHLPVINDRYAVDQYVLHALRQAVGGLVGRRVADGCRIEERIDRILLPLARHLRQSLTLQRQEPGLVDHADHDRLRTRDLIPFIVPLR